MYGSKNRSVSVIDRCQRVSEGCDPTQCLKKFRSPFFVKTNSQVWSASFSPNIHTSNIICMAHENGIIKIVRLPPQINAYTNEVSLLTTTEFPAHSNGVLDIKWTSEKSERKLLSISGDETSKLWDLGCDEAVCLQIFRGHAGTVRCADWAPDNPNLFVTGGRDGQICVWDIRSKAAALPVVGRHLEESYGGWQNVGPLPDATAPKDKISHAHLRTDENQRNRLISPQVNGKIRKGVKRKSTPGQRCDFFPYLTSTLPKITSVQFCSSDKIISTSDQAKTGVRMWDLRKSHLSYVNRPPKPYRQMKFSSNSDKYGFISSCMSRDRSTLYVVCTDQSIYEYSLNSANDNPVRRLIGLGGSSFYIQSVFSPLSGLDVLLSGSCDGKPKFWTLPSLIQYPDTTILPSYEMQSKSQSQSCDHEVSSVAWSVDGSSIVTCAEDGWRYWTWDQYTAENLMIRKDPARRILFDENEENDSITRGEMLEGFVSEVQGGAADRRASLKENIPPKRPTESETISQNGDQSSQSQPKRARTSLRSSQTSILKFLK